MVVQILHYQHIIFDSFVTCFFQNFYFTNISKHVPRNIYIYTFCINNIYSDSFKLLRHINQITLRIRGLN